MARPALAPGRRLTPLGRRAHAKARSRHRAAPGPVQAGIRRSVAVSAGRSIAWWWRAGATRFAANAFRRAGPDQLLERQGHIDLSRRDDTHVASPSSGWGEWLRTPRAAHRDFAPMSI